MNLLLIVLKASCVMSAAAIVSALRLSPLVIGGTAGPLRPLRLFLGRQPLRVGHLQ